MDFEIVSEITAIFPIGVKEFAAAVVYESFTVAINGGS